MARAIFLSPSYESWKKMAQKAVGEGKVAKCVACGDPIVPGDFVAQCYLRGDDTPHLIHAGYHWSLSQEDAFCETGAMGSGHWDGEKFVRHGESAAAKALRTGEPQVKEY